MGMKETKNKIDSTLLAICKINVCYVVRMSVESVTILFAIRKNGWSNQVTIQIFTIEIYGPKFI